MLHIFFLQSSLWQCSNLSPLSSLSHCWVQSTAGLSPHCFPTAHLARRQTLNSFSIITLVLATLCLFRTSASTSYTGVGDMSAAVPVRVKKNAHTDALTVEQSSINTDTGRWRGVRTRLVFQVKNTGCCTGNRKLILTCKVNHSLMILTLIEEKWFTVQVRRMLLFPVL